MKSFYLSRITTASGQSRKAAAMTEDGKLKELFLEDKPGELPIGTVLLGSIQEVVPGLSAAFVNCGFEQKAFLPIPERQLSRYKAGQELPVQLKARPTGQKGAVVSDSVSFAGRYLVVSYPDDRLSISSKITDPTKRTEIKALLTELQAGHPYGFIFRTAAENAREDKLRAEAAYLTDLADKTLRMGNFSRLGGILYSPSPSHLAYLALLPSEEVDEIVTDSAELRDELLELRPDFADKIRIFKDERWSLFDFYKITTGIAEASNRRVYLEDNGYLVIDKTEALTVIDVNSSKSVASREKEKAVLELNQKAAKAAADAVRLRNLSGIILIDFIDMKTDASKEALLQTAREAFSHDRLKVRVYGFTALGLMEISRERQNAALSERLAE